jgi:hypothetical protein
MAREDRGRRWLVSIARSKQRPTFDKASVSKRKGLGTGATGLEPATSGVTGRRSNQLNYAPRARQV